MNRPIPSWLLSLWQESLWKTKCMSPAHSFSWKSSHFYVKRFARALRSATQKWKLSLHMSQVAHQASDYLGLCSMKRLGVFVLPPTVVKFVSTTAARERFPAFRMKFTELLQFPVWRDFRYDDVHARYLWHLYPLYSLDVHLHLQMGGEFPTYWKYLSVHGGCFIG